MKQFFSVILITLFGFNANAQKLGRISLEVNYGLNGNFFVRSYDESIPPPAKLFYKKKFIGQIAGIELRYNLNSTSSIGLAYANSVNKRKINYSNGTNARILYFTISHIDNFYQLFYERAFSKKNTGFKFNSGIFYLRMKQQEIDASPAGVLFEERDFKHYKLEEVGIFLGIHFSKRIDTRFQLGVKSRIYYLLSTNEFEAITLTPTLTYTF
ncbi:MAG TPA: hypothetical protein VMY77_10745 [Chitinophagaceae bacterium]|nr:hypothetical protein [Chitinophagaceae bacterium]